MGFTTASFFLLVLLCLAATARLPNRSASKKGLLTLASYYFYMTWDIRLGLLLSGLTLVNWVAGHRIARGGRVERQVWLALSVGASLGALAYFKYADFFLESLNRILGLLEVSWRAGLLDLMLPIGISFIAFQALTYPVDLYRGKLGRPYSLLDVSLFVAFFPKLLSGPLTRAHQFLPQCDSDRRYDDDKVVEGLVLIGRGLVQKLLIADVLSAHVVDPGFASPTAFSPAFLTIGVVAYSFQIYMDLAGYTDIARGTAKLLGYELPKNFDRPYLATSISNFWQRWHISMSSFFRDYLYFSIGGSKYGNVYFNLMVTFIAIGFWHGAGWNFLLYGFLHGAMVCGERYMRQRRERLGLPPKEWHGPMLALRIAQVFAVVCMTRLLFRGGSIEGAWQYLVAMTDFSVKNTPLTLPALVALTAAIALHLVPKDAAQRAFVRVQGWSPASLAAGGVSVVFTSLAVGGGSAAFIYFQF